MGSAPKQKCPYCGALVRAAGGLTPWHEEDTGRRLRPQAAIEPCAGSRQNPRSPFDMRPLWRDEDRAGHKWDPYIVVAPPQRDRAAVPNRA